MQLTEQGRSNTTRRRIAEPVDELPWQQPAWEPQEGPQCEAIEAEAIDELFYGGAAGGGKSDFLLGDFLQGVPMYGAAWRGILFRRSMGEHEDLIERAQYLFPRTGAFYNAGTQTWRWPNGASFRFRYLEKEKDKYRYQGHAYTWMGWDELTQWPTDSAYRYLRGRLRSAHNVPLKRIRSAGNPGGPGHSWVKAYFISPAPAGFAVLTDPVTMKTRTFIPSRLSDNKILTRNDPNYKGNLAGMGSAALVKAMLEGDWNVIEGAFFDCWSSRQHIIRPFSIPKNWVRFRSADWGSASPFSVGWWAVVQDDFQLPDGRILPRGAVVRYREWYGTRNPAVPGPGLKLFAEQFGEGIRTREMDDPKLSWGVLDPSAFKQDGGPPISEGINKVLLKAGLAAFRPADNTRVTARGQKDRRGPMSGWDQVRGRMVGTAKVNVEDGSIDWKNGKPMAYWFDTCIASIRTIPLLQHDKNYAEDLDTTSEDHCADDTRYGMNSRPWMRSAVEVEPANEGYKAADDDEDTLQRDSFMAI